MMKPERPGRATATGSAERERARMVSVSFVARRHTRAINLSRHIGRRCALQSGPAATARESPVLHTRLRRVPHQACSITARPQLLVADGAQQLLGLGRAQAASAPPAFRVPRPMVRSPPPPLGGVLVLAATRGAGRRARGSTSPHGRAAAAAGLRGRRRFGVGPDARHGPRCRHRPGAARASRGCTARGNRMSGSSDAAACARLAWAASASESASAAVPRCTTRRPLSVGRRAPSGTPRAPGGGHDGPTPSPRGSGEPGLLCRARGRERRSARKAIPTSAAVRREAACTTSTITASISGIQARGRLCSVRGLTRARPPIRGHEVTHSAGLVREVGGDERPLRGRRPQRRARHPVAWSR